MTSGCVASLGIAALHSTYELAGYQVTFVGTVFFLVGGHLDATWMYDPI